MSDSRLEKFIYAICSMDVSDLPVPLSQIEKLWNCLITGETPDFEPLSRNEKYLMAMLDRYDISNLPAPMSRGEKLLYKIAVGETDLSDVPGYLSRYEELLKYLIENGGIGFEYVLYTLNQSLSTLYSTAEKPVKSAILKGQTLVNYLKIRNVTKEGMSYNVSSCPLKGNTKYVFLANVPTNTNNQYNFKYIYGDGTTGGDFSVVNRGVSGHITKIFTTPDRNDIINLNSYNVSNMTDNPMAVNDMMLIEYQEGMENWDIPYFEGMSSVKMPVLTTTGKNLLTELVLGDINSSSGLFVGGTAWKSTDFINVDNMNNIVFHSSIPFNKANFVFFTYDKNKNYLGYKAVYNSFDTASISLENNIKYVRFRVPSDVPTGANLQLEQGTTPTTYEPYKSNILTVNEPVELRGIGDVQDELDLLTGEVVEHIGEIVLDGSENWSVNGDRNTVISFICSDVIGSLNADKIMSSKFPTRTDGETADVEMIRLSAKSGKIIIHILKTKASTSTEFKAWLSQNPITVQYGLATESIKTVDLTTVDQDGQPTKLKTFNDITHVEINADNLLPSVDVEVATKINKTLSTMGPQQLDISNTQNKLGQTIKEQTENTDATMMATTEIYEQTL